MLAHIPITMRAPLALAWVVCMAPRVSVAADPDLSGFPPELARSIEMKLEALAAARIGSDRVRQKLREGRAKKVPAARIIHAVVRLADHQLWASAQLEGCKLEPSAGDRVIELAADLLFDSLPQSLLVPALRHLCADKEAAAKLGQASELYSFLSHKLGATPEAAWAFAFELMRRGEERGTVHRLVPVLQEIYRSKRSIDRPLEIAVARLRAGASLRAVRNELRDQFLRR